MPIIAKDNKRQYRPAPEGLHQAVCCDVIDLGLQETPWGRKEKVEIRWQLDMIDETADPPRKYITPKWYTLSLNEKATLRHHLESWRGKKFTKAELDGFDLEKLIGVNCQLQIIHVPKDDGGVYGQIQAVVPLGRGMMKLQIEEYERDKDRPKQRQRGVASNGDGPNDNDDPGQDDTDIPF